MVGKKCHSDKLLVPHMLQSPLKYPPASLLSLPVLSLNLISVGVVNVLVSTGLMLSRVVLISFSAHEEVLGSFRFLMDGRPSLKLRSGPLE